MEEIREDAPPPLDAPPPKPPWQYSLRSLFVLTTVCALLLSAATTFRELPGLIGEFLTSVLCMFGGLSGAIVVMAGFLLIADWLSPIPGEGGEPEILDTADSASPFAEPRETTFPDEP